MPNRPQKYDASTPLRKELLREICDRGEKGFLPGELESYARLFHVEPQKLLRSCRNRKNYVVNKGIVAELKNRVEVTPAIISEIAKMFSVPDAKVKQLAEKA